jgi:chemotaxis protein MotB
LIPDSYNILKGLARAIDGYEYEPLKAVEVFGHTDNRPVTNSSGRYPSNWELGAARAISVVRYLGDKGDIEQKRFEASTPGPYHPRVSNETKEGRRKNRRVEIFVRYAERKTEKPKERQSEKELTQNVKENQP